MNNRREIAEADYRRKFDELGLDGFEFLRREWTQEHDKRFWVRCKKCGAELLRHNDVLRGKTKSLACRECGNGCDYATPFADEVLAYLANKHTYIETCEKFGISKNKLSAWAKAQGVTNGRTINEINKAKSLISAQKARERCENRIAVDLLQHGFGYLEGYKNGDSTIRLTHFECGAIFERHTDYFRKYGYSCPACEAVKAEERRVERQRIKDEEREEKQKAREQQKAERKEQHEHRLNELHTCKVCGTLYSIRDYMKDTGTKYERDSGFCSAACRKLNEKAKEKERRKLRAPDNHRARAKRFGCEYETGITLKKLVARDGLTCALCGELCDWNDRNYSKWCGPLYPSIDHIIPMSKGGGHTWKNVQVAHIICNSKKETSLDYGGQ